MCLECGHYNGRQVMDLEAEKAKREARIKAKEERIKAEMGTPAPDINETTEEVPTEDTSKEAREEDTGSHKPEKKPE